MLRIKSIGWVIVYLVSVGVLSFGAGLLWSSKSAHAEEAPKPAPSAKTVYPKNTELDFEGTKIQGEMYSPGEFYFQVRKGNQFGSLVKRRENFHREMLRDVVLSR